MLTVACVLKSGGIYDATWVARLRAGVARHLQQPHRFVCLSDVPVPCERLPLERGWAGWWSKLELFKQLSGPALYFDLDTAVVGDLADIGRQAEQWQFTLLRDFYRLGDGLGSGVMAWNVDLLRLYETFLSDPARWQIELADRGDQGFIEENVNLRGVARWQDLLPGQIVSYKAQGCAAGIPPGARVICLHGKPKFADMPTHDAVRQAWERAA